MVDTCAAEFEAATPYFYSTYEEENEAAAADRRTRRWSSAAGPSASARASSSTTAACTPPGRCRTPAYKAIMINSNPETVSTDFDTSDRLYFEPLDEEACATSWRTSRRGTATARRPSSSSAGRRPSTWPSPLARAGLPILGSSAEAIDLAEDRAPLRGPALAPGHPPAARRRRHPRRGGAGRRPDSSATRCWCAPATCSAAGPWRSSTNASELIRYMQAGGASWPAATPSSSTSTWRAERSRSTPSATASAMLIPGIMEHIERAGVHSRRLHGRLPARQPDRGGGRHHGRLHRSASASPCT